MVGEIGSVGCEAHTKRCLRFVNWLLSNDFGTNKQTTPSSPYRRVLGSALAWCQVRVWLTVAKTGFSLSLISTLVLIFSTS